MIEIAPYRHLAIVPLLAIAFGCLVITFIVSRFTAAAIARHRLYWSAIIVGALCALGSGTLRSARHSGTGTQTEWGWPRVVYTRWASWEVDERREGVRWQGLIENTVFYGAAAVMLVSLGLAVRRRPLARDGRHGPVV